MEFSNGFKRQMKKQEMMDSIHAELSDRTPKDPYLQSKHSNGQHDSNVSELNHGVSHLSLDPQVIQDQTPTLDFDFEAFKKTIPKKELEYFESGEFMDVINEGIDILDNLPFLDLGYSCSQIPIDNEPFTTEEVAEMFND